MASQSCDGLRCVQRIESTAEIAKRARVVDGRVLYVLNKADQENTMSKAKGKTKTKPRANTSNAAAPSALDDLKLRYYEKIFDVARTLTEQFVSQEIGRRDEATCIKNLQMLLETRRTAPPSFHARLDGIIGNIMALAERLTVISEVDQEVNDADEAGATDVDLGPDAMPQA